ncbi:LacI family DNA-binding transcriptional regulator [Tropicibacter sp. R15_0]|uniref:LacI family DNA-binding transcriptional regulator n=1 Tax=Tropicibacter sp. R15_0 TaxID=2821101 RepID=UPI001ADC2719|nr:LacI family DNA-binding transcriptional regulator [Tropicibacter sp. R15_0]MBO9467875.1 LacI family DNA-binding transcriptional regulator [Tropicibacter sp. R15_0]
MARKPKLETVAKEAGVSTATASQVMRGAGRISDATRKKVLEAAHKLHYVPDGRAASMRSGINREIGLVIHQIANPFNAEVISGVSDLLEAEGFLVSVLDSRDDVERQRRNIQAFIRNARGGLLWVPADDTDDTTYDLLRTHGIPTVTFLRHLPSEPFDHVGIRDADATRKATEHLADLGHRHIAFLGGKSRSFVRTERIAGYSDVMQERGLAEPLVWDTEDDKMSGMEAMVALRTAHPEVTAIVCNGDMVAIGASLALQKMGQTPGHDVSIVGFDDVQDAAVSTPPLTTMAVSPYQLGRKLAQIMLDRLQAPDTPPTVTQVAATLITRSTTGAPPAG